MNEIGEWKKKREMQWILMKRCSGMMEIDNRRNISLRVNTK